MLGILAYLRSSADKTAQAVNNYNDGDLEGSTNALYGGISDMESAKAHLIQSTSLL